MNCSCHRRAAPLSGNRSISAQGVQNGLDVLGNKRLYVDALGRTQD
jgi:hypothetical protein